MQSTKVRTPGFNLRHLERAIPAPELPMGQVETSIQLHVVSFSTCPVRFHISPYKYGSSEHPHPPTINLLFVNLSVSEPVSQEHDPKQSAQAVCPHQCQILGQPAEAQEIPATSSYWTSNPQTCLHSPNPTLRPHPLQGGMIMRPFYG